MHYLSTRDSELRLTFSEAVMAGLSRDGGLLLPATIPDVRDRLSDWRHLSYVELATEVMQLFVDFPPDEFADLVARSYASFRSPEVTPVRRLGDLFLLELFHGPTLAFKDVALQFLGNVFETLLEREGRELNILGATSGDTGSAAIYGVRGKERIRIFIMHPHGRVSPVQERQMTTVLDENVFNLSVEGTFDDCQGIMKDVFGDLAFRDRYALGAVNSINWARVLAQVVYYFYATFRVQDATGAARVRFAVPTGNFGDVFAGYVAARMGLPVGRLILATNENDILSRFFTTGVYELGDVVPTLSPSMDIQVASNFERYLYYRVGEQSDVLARLMHDFSNTGRLSVPPADEGAEAVFSAGRADRATTVATIRRVYEEEGVLLDPHTAVGVSVAADFLDASEPTICLATAHPAKFPGAIHEAVGQDIARHAEIDRLGGKATRSETIPASAARIKAFLSTHIHGGQA